MRRLASGLLALALLHGTAFAQPAGVPTLDEAMPMLPDPARYRVEIAPSDMSADQVAQLVQMIGDAARGQHFYGAVYGYRPADDDRTEYKMRSGLHSRAAARAGALADCEAARSDGDTECALVGEILPEGWTDTMPELSHMAVQAIAETGGALPGNVVVARSESGDGFEIRSGDDVRDATLAACNAANAAAGLPADCAIVIDDLN